MISNTVTFIVDTKYGPPTNMESNIVGHNGPMQCNLSGNLAFGHFGKKKLKKTVMCSAERMHYSQRRAAVGI